MPIFHLSDLQAEHLTFGEMKHENCPGMPRLQFKNFCRRLQFMQTISINSSNSPDVVTELMRLILR